MKAMMKMETLSELAAVDWPETLTDDDIEHNNTVRAGWAAQGVLTMARATRLLSERNDEDVATAVGDLLGNLAHLCDLAGLDFAERVEHGLHNRYEQAEA